MGGTICIDDAVVARLLPQLNRAARLGHSGRSFLEHLLRTWRILADWRMPVAVCRAGLLHSAYSTSFYPHALFRIDERSTVRCMIGRDAEDLAFRFCTMDRRGFWDGLVRGPHVGSLTYRDRTRGNASVRVSRKTLRQLLIIESANIAEQSSAPDGGPAPWMSRVLRWWEFLDDPSIPLRVGVRPRLTKRADEAGIEAYRLALNAPTRKAKVLLDHAIQQNPWAAEPRILRALCALDRENAAVATDTRAATQLLFAWAVAWDKRLTLDAWKKLAQRTESALSDRRSSSRLDFHDICAVLSDQAQVPRWLQV